MSYDVRARNVLSGCTPTRYSIYHIFIIMNCVYCLCMYYMRLLFLYTLLCLFRLTPSFPIFLAISRTVFPSFVFRRSVGPFSEYNYMFGTMEHLCIRLQSNSRTHTHSPICGCTLRKSHIECNTFPSRILCNTADVSSFTSPFFTLSGRPFAKSFHKQDAISCHSNSNGKLSQTITIFYVLSIRTYIARVCVCVRSHL